LGPIYPLDKTANAEGRRRTLHTCAVGSSASAADESSLSDELPPLLRKCLADYAATGR